MSKLYALNGDELGSKEVVEECVTALKNALKKAENGEMIGVVIVSEMKTGPAEYTTAGQCVSWSMVGGLEIAKSVLIEKERG